MIGIASWALATKHLNGSKDVTWAWDYIFDITIYILVVAFFALLLSTFGCLGALRENIILLRIVSGLVALSFVCLAVAAASVFFSKVNFNMYVSFNRNLKKRLINHRLCRITHVSKDRGLPNFYEVTKFEVLRWKCFQKLMLLCLRSPAAATLAFEFRLCLENGV